MTPFSFLYFKKLMGKNRVEFPAICIQLNCSISLVCVFHTFRMFLQTQIKQTNIFLVTMFLGHAVVERALSVFSECFCAKSI